MIPNDFEAISIICFYRDYRNYRNYRTVKVRLLIQLKFYLLNFINRLIQYLVLCFICHVSIFSPLTLKVKISIYENSIKMIQAIQISMHQAAQNPD